MKASVAMNDSVKWLETLNKITGIAQTGLHYSKDVYDKERYEQLLGHIEYLLELKEISNNLRDIKKFLFDKEDDACSCKTIGDSITDKLKKFEPEKLKKQSIL